MRASRTTLSSLVVASATVAVGGTSIAATEPPVATEPSTAATGFSITAALAELPDELLDDANLISMGDITAVTAAAGLTTPDLASDDYITWLLAITGQSSTAPDEEPAFVPVPVILPSSLVENARAAAELGAAIGFTIADVEWFADVANLPSTFSVYAGAFDDSTLPDTLTPVEPGIVSLGEGEDFSQQLDSPTPLSRIGVPQRLAQLDGRVVVSSDTPLVRDWLAGTANATDDDLGPVAAALDDAGAISAVLGSLGDLDEVAGRRVSPEQREAILEQVGDAALTDVFDDAVGIGWNAVDDESVISIVYTLDDDVDAAGADAAVEAVRGLFTNGTSFLSSAPIADYLTLDDVTTDGTVVVATLRPGAEGRPLTAFQMLVQQDLPFAVLGD